MATWTSNTELSMTFCNMQPAAKNDVQYMQSVGLYRNANMSASAYMKQDSPVYKRNHGNYFITKCKKWRHFSNQRYPVSGGGEKKPYFWKIPRLRPFVVR